MRQEVLMAIKAGSIITVGHGTTLIERLQSGGPGQLNIPKTKVYELGNYKAVATVRDTPELTFTLESFDVSTDTEALLCDVSPETDGIDLGTAIPLNIIQNFKPGKKLANPFTAAKGVAIPYLTVESVSYKFGYKDNATETVTLKGDSIYYTAGPAYIDEFDGTGTAGQQVQLSHPAYAYGDGAKLTRVLAVTVGLNRLTEGPDFTLTYGAVTDGASPVTVHLVEPVAVGTKIRVTFHSPDPVTYPETIHTPATLKPAAIRGKDIKVYIGGYDPAHPSASAANLWTGVQDVSVDWRVTQEVENELGNANAVSRDFDTPTCSGSIGILPRDVADLFRKIRLITGVTDLTKAVGPDVAVPLPLDIVITDPETGGTTLKRLHVDDARFSVPGYSPRVEQNVTMSLEWESDEGGLTVFRDLTAPVITGLEEPSGKAGDTVLISGVNFIGVTAVKFGATAATSYTVRGHRQIEAVVPAGTNTVDVTVTNAKGTSAVDDDAKFTYIA
jgi:hypothetical protein